LYPFGHGLSYTRVAYTDLRIDPATARTADAVRVSLNVKNSGTRAGAEVVQLYTRALSPKLPMPIKQLRGFERITLAPGEQRGVTFRLTPGADFSHYDVGSTAFAVAPGDYEIQLGASSRDIRLAGRVSVP
jgi:beta-glucosidase